MEIYRKELNLLEEMSVLNNEMANAQRILEKQNVEMKNLNKQLKEVNSQLEQFTYVASHDLKEPLRMVSSFMHLLKIQYAGQLDKKANRYIDFALDGGIRMEKMINDLLDFSITGNSEKTKELTDINRMIELTIHDLGRLIELNKGKIEIQTIMPELFVYPAELARVFQNLLSNAIKFTRTDIAPVIKIRAEEKENEWQFAIEDNGIGIENEYSTKVFKIFTRLHSRKEYEGSGIGLATCKKIIEQHGGDIWIQSGKDKGSIFNFTLPKE